MSRGHCRFCEAPLSTTFVDLGSSPPSNSFVDPARLADPEPRFPLHAFVCDDCLLVQLEEFQRPDEIFSDYLYFSSYSESWLQHARAFAEAMVSRLALGPRSLVIEVASNDGYLLQFFVQRGIPVLGIEPAANVAAEAERKGVPTRVQFFGQDAARQIAAEGGRADLLVGNNVLAHVPDINDFVAGIALALKPEGVLSLEFPHLLRLIEGNQYDTIYHEHFSYLSLLVVERVLRAHGLAVFDLEEIPTHGGSLRIFAGHEGAGRSMTGSVARVRADEAAARLTVKSGYEGFQAKVEANREKVREFLARAKADGKRVVGYGAPAKANTLLNYCGVGTDLIPFTCDRSPHKQGRLLPGTHIPVRPPEAIAEARPDYVVILAWNLRDEISAQLGYIRDWGAKFVTFIPRVEVWP